jgi:hypothetical protein
MLNSGPNVRAAVFRFQGASRIVRQLFVILAVLMALSAATNSYAAAPRVEERVHAGEVCWDPDVEFPVPCDDDED